MSASGIGSGNIKFANSVVLDKSDEISISGLYCIPFFASDFTNPKNLSKLDDDLFISITAHKRLCPVCIK